MTFTERIENLRAVLAATASTLADPWDESQGLVFRALSTGGKILLFGNGGSAADASHIAAEFVGRFRRERRGWPAIALGAELAAITAIANDYSFDVVFSRQIEALGSSRDVAIGLSTSGKSENVLRGLEQAAEMKMTTIALTGKSGLSRGSADIIVRVPSEVTYEIQEVHKVFLHSVCDRVEERMIEAGRG